MHMRAKSSYNYFQKLSLSNKCQGFSFRSLRNSLCVVCLPSFPDGHSRDTFLAHLTTDRSGSFSRMTRNRSEIPLSASATSQAAAGTNLTLVPQ